MIPITCDLARRFRSVVRRSVMDSSRSPWPIVVARLHGRAVSLEAVQNDLGVRFELDCDPNVSTAGDATVAFRADVLAQFAGTSGVVVLQEAVRGKARAMWKDGGSPRSVEFEAVGPDSVPPFPHTEVRLNPVTDDFLAALGEAVQTAAKESIKLGLTRILLRGKGGEVIASDSHQLLICRGFPFPWAGDILIPRVPAFAGKELTGEAPIGVGHSDRHVVLRIGNWTFALPIDTESRFPQIEAVIPGPRSMRGKLHIDPKDAAELLSALPRMPGRADEKEPVTLDLSTPPAVRARDEPDGPVAEYVLGRSNVAGPPVRVVTNRSFLRRALDLGFDEIQIASPNKPVVCRDAKRLYVWMPLEPCGAIGPTAASRTMLPAATADAVTTTRRPRRIAPVSPTTNGHTSRQKPGEPHRLGPAEVIVEAQAVRGLLCDAGLRLANLVRALKQQRQQTRAVQQAVHSLRQLQLDR